MQIPHNAIEQITDREQKRENVLLLSMSTLLQTPQMYNYQIKDSECGYSF